VSGQCEVRGTTNDRDAAVELCLHNNEHGLYEVAGFGLYAVS
jgi:hypothetical protein